MSMIERSDNDRTYQDFLQQVTALVRQRRVGVARSVNRELIRLYWGVISNSLLEKFRGAAWSKGG